MHYMGYYLHPILFRNFFELFSRSWRHCKFEINYKFIDYEPCPTKSDSFLLKYSHIHRKCFLFYRPECTSRHLDAMRWECIKMKLLYNRLNHMEIKLVSNECYHNHKTFTGFMAHGLSIIICIYFFNSNL